MTTDFDFSAPAVVSADDALEFEDDIRDPANDEIPSGPICKTCRKVIVREPGKRGRAPSYHPECRPSAQKSSTPRKKTAKKAAGVPDYQEGLNGIFQMVAWGLTIAGDRDERILADGLALGEHAPNISGAINQLAQEKPEIAAVLDRVLAVGPYGVLLAAVTPLLMQIGSNHGVKVPGMKDAKAYVAQFIPTETAQAA